MNNGYFDYAASTPVDPRVSQAMQVVLEQDFGNPSSTHLWGQSANGKIEIAKLELAKLVECAPDDLIFTGSASEAINLAIKGSFFGQSHKKHIISFTPEHRATLNTLKALQAQGADITLLPVDQNGLINLDQLAEHIRPDTLMISVMHVHNEYGVIQPLTEIAALAAQKGVLLHIDASQSLGKTSFSLKDIAATFVTFSAHKMYGPKGIGALYIARDPAVSLSPQIHGGFANRGLRAGTLASHQIVGMGMAAQCVRLADTQAETQHVMRCQQAFLSTLKNIPYTIHACAATRVPHIINIELPIQNDRLFYALKNYAFSKGSACTAGLDSPSHALLAIGKTSNQIEHSIRVSFGRFSTESDSASFAQNIMQTILTKQ